MRGRVKTKFASPGGATVVTALAVFLAVTLLSAVLVNNALSVARNAYAQIGDEQAALAATSAARMLQALLEQREDSDNFPAVCQQQLLETDGTHYSATGPAEKHAVLTGSAKLNAPDLGTGPGEYTVFHPDPLAATPRTDTADVVTGALVAMMGELDSAPDPTKAHAERTLRVLPQVSSGNPLEAGAMIDLDIRKDGTGYFLNATVYTGVDSGGTVDTADDLLLNRIVLKYQVTPDPDREKKITVPEEWGVTPESATLFTLYPLKFQLYGIAR